MKRNPRHRLLAALLTFFALIVGAMLPISVASAASPSTSCPPGFVEEGPPGPPTCILVISAPESVPAGQVFTVHVLVTTDGTTVAKSDPCASKVLIRLDIEGGDESFNSYFANAKAGIATFNVSVAHPGSYVLVANAALSEGDTTSCGSYSYTGDTANLMAVNVAAGQPIAPCPDNVSCTQTTSGSGSAATLFANTGSFDASFTSFVPAIGCGDGGPADPNGVLSFLYAGPDTKTIVLALSPSLVTRGIGQYKICWTSDHPFTQLGGTQTPPGPNACGPLGTSTCFIGYLPACKNNDAGPCVAFKTSGQHNDAFFGIIAPPGDPLAYPGG
jgi:hypothetical protein